MSSEQLLRVVAVLAAVLVMWGVVALASRGSAGNPEAASILPKIDTAAIDTIAIAGPGDTLVLARAGTVGWRVNGHPADAQAVSGLLKGLVDTATAAELIARNPSSHARLRVTEDSGRRVRIVSQGKVILELIAGKQTTDWRGVYLRRDDEPAVYAVRGDLTNALGRQGDEWRDRTIAAVNPESVGTVEIRRDRESYKLQRKDSAWVFASGAPADSAAVARLLSSYKEVKAASFAAAAQKDSLRFARPRRTARLLDQRGTPLLSLVFDSIASGIWVKPAGGQGDGEAYQLDSWTADELTPAESTFRKR